MMKNPLSVLYFDSFSDEIIEYHSHLSSYYINMIYFPIGLSEQLQYSNSQVKIGSHYFNGSPITMESIPNLFDKTMSDYMLIIPYEMKYNAYIESIIKQLSNIGTRKCYIINHSNSSYHNLQSDNIIYLESISSINKFEITSKYQFNATTILIFGLSEATNKLHTHLSLSEKLRSEGYKVANIGCESFSRYFAFHTFPDCIYDNIPINMKIKIFQDYIKQIEEEELPNVILISIPGYTQIESINDMKYKLEQEIPYVVSKAIKGDFCILNMLINNIKDESFERNFYFYQGQIENNIDCICISNKAILIDNNEEKVLIEVMDTTEDTMIKNYLNQKNVYRYNDSDGIYQAIINKLGIDENMITFDYLL